MSVNDYNNKIAEMVIGSMKKFLEQEQKLQRRGGGGGGPDSYPLPIMGDRRQPSTLATPTPMRGRKPRAKQMPKEMSPEPRQIGGKFNFAKAIKKVGLQGKDKL